jgi:radical SAM superfamily enzyme YgiQ (UPF0313 family)
MDDEDKELIEHLAWRLRISEQKVKLYEKALKRYADPKNWQSHGDMIKNRIYLPGRRKFPPHGWEEARVVLIKTGVVKP